MTDSPNLTETPAPAASTDKPKRKVGFRHKMALLQIIERKRLSDSVDYGAIAARTGISNGSLRKLWSEYQHGKIDLGEPQTLAEQRIDSRVQHEKLLASVKRYLALVLDGCEAVCIRAEDAMSNGDPLGWKAVGAHDAFRELRMLMAMNTEAEKGYMAILQDMAEAQRQPEKQLLAPYSPEIKTAIVTASDEQKALAALGLDMNEPPDR
jgi:hypothetical protein